MIKLLSALQLLVSMKEDKLGKSANFDLSQYLEYIPH